MRDDTDPVLDDEIDDEIEGEDDGNEGDVDDDNEIADDLVENEDAVSEVAHEPEVSFEPEWTDEPEPKSSSKSKKSSAKRAAASLPEPEVTEPAPAEERVVRYARLSEIRIEHKFWQNPRTRSGLEDAKIKALADSISARSTTDEAGVVTAGLQTPLDVVPIKSNGEVILLAIDGQRRTRAMEYLGLPSDTLVPVFYYKPDPVDWTPMVAAELLLEVVEMAATREGLSSFELAEVAARLRDSKDADTGKEYTMAKIAKAIDRSESWCSKMLGAMKAATPALLLKWKKGEVTDEQFKDLAATKEPSKQKAALEAVVEAKSSGDARGARSLAKEAKVIAKRDEPKPKKLAKGEQASLDTPPPMKPPPGAILDDLIRLSNERPPTHDYVRGIMDGIRYARGGVDPQNFSKPWSAYMALVTGEAPSKPKGKAKPAKAGKAKPKKK